MANFEVSVRFNAVDKVARPMDRMGRSVDKFGRRADRSFKKASRSALGFGSVVKGILTAGALRRGFTALGAGVAEVRQEFLDFDQQITGAAARFPGRIQRGSAAFKELGTEVRKVASVSEFTAAQVAKGLGEYAKAGLSASQSMGLLAKTSELATNAEVEFATAASISLDALDSFNLRSKDSATTAANLARVNDVLTRTVTSAKLDFEDFSQTLKFTGPVADSLGAKLEDMATLTGLVAKAGIRGTTAGTTLKSTYLGLIKTSGKGAKALRRIGVSVKDSNGDMRDGLQILIDFKNATQKMGNAQRAAITDTVFGQRAIAGVSKILSLGVEDLKEYAAKMKDSQNASVNMATAMRQSLTNRLKVLKSGLIEIGFKIFDAFSNKGSKFMDRLIEGVQKFDVQPVIDGIKQAIDWMKKGIKFVVTYKDEILAVAGVLSSVSLVGKIAEGVPAVVGALKALRSPVTWIIIGIAAVAAVVIKFRKELSPTISALRTGFQPVVENVSEIINQLRGSFGNTNINLSDLISTVSKATAPFVELAVKMHTFPLVFITGAISKVVNAFQVMVEVGRITSRQMSEAWAKLKKALEPVFNFIGRAVASATRVFKPFIDLTVRVFGPTVKSAIDTISGAIQTLTDKLSSLKSMFGGFPSKALGFLGKITGVTAVSELFSEAQSNVDTRRAAQERERTKLDRVEEIFEQRKGKPQAPGFFGGVQNQTSVFNQTPQLQQSPAPSLNNELLQSLAGGKSEPQEINLTFSGLPEGVTVSQSKSTGAPPIIPGLSGAAI
jgi:TP901 family phage tail tape measure protein